MAAMDSVSVGVDTTSGHTLTYAALDRDLKPLVLSEGEIEELTGFLAGQKTAFVAVNSPSHLSTGLVRQQMRRERPGARVLRGAEIRLAEHELRQRGIAVSATPSNATLSPPWVQLGLSLYATLAEQGFQPFPCEDAEHQFLETHPHAVFTVLLGCLPLPKPTLEGRLQRALVLFERGVRIRDPMTFLEEITRHRLLHGVLPTELLPLPQQLDALAAAYTAWVASHKPEEIVSVGADPEGSISLPVPTLQDHY